MIGSVLWRVPIPTDGRQACDPAGHRGGLQVAGPLLPGGTSQPEHGTRSTSPKNPGPTLCEPATTLTPEHTYERRWAQTSLEQALANLQQEYARAGNSTLFDELSDQLWGRDVSISYAEIGERLGMTEGAVRRAMHRLRQRYRERLRAEIAHTLADVSDVDEELRYLITVVGQKEQPPTA